MEEVTVQPIVFESSAVWRRCGTQRCAVLTRILFAPFRL
jgi:hypothetical protein